MCLLQLKIKVDINTPNPHQQTGDPDKIIKKEASEFNNIIDKK